MTETHVEFRFPDPDDVLAGVSLLQEVARPRHGIPFLRFPGTGEWRLSMARPEALRIEYRFEIHHRDGSSEVQCDPASELRASGPFGDRSVLEFPGYERPAWLESDPPPGRVEDLTISSDALQTEVHGLFWRSAGSPARRSLPLLIVHDGPEYAHYASLLHLLDWAIDAGRLPPMRAALLAPLERNRDYAASPIYTYALTQELLPALEREMGGKAASRVGMGASLGALSMLHAHRSYPSTFSGLFLQSGSFFQPQFDSMEAEVPLFGPVTRFVDRVLHAPGAARTIPVAMTAGAAEENLYNNRDLRDALTKQGYDVMWHEQPDAHNWVSWRDSWDPLLVDFLAGLWKQ